jgi:hypothetical protein
VKWLLDTNVVSESTKARPDKSVRNWVDRQPLEQVAISAVTLAELVDGAASAGVDARRRALHAWLETSVDKMFAGRILPLQHDILVDWLRLTRKLAAGGITRQAPDLLIAATARVHDLILVSRNVRDFADTGVLLFDPWHGKHHQMDEP